MTGITRETRVCRSSDLLTTEVDGETVMMNVETGHYHSLDAIGGDIWARLEHQTTPAALAAALARDYDAPRDTIERDILNLLNEMAAQGLVIAAD